MTAEAPAQSGIIGEDLDGRPVEEVGGTQGAAGPEADAGAGTIEAVLAGTQRATESALRASATVTREIRTAAGGARTGQIRQLRKALDAACGAAEALAGQLRELRDGFDLDETAYLESGAYAKELLAAATAAGVSIFEEEDRLLCYPSLLRVVPADAVVEIDRVRERRIRPSVLVSQLERAQGRAPKFRAEAFLDSLRTAYELVVLKNASRPDGVVRVVDLWAALTMLPGQRGQYSKQEFARDLYLLDQSGVVSTARSPRTLRWAASTGTKGAGVLLTVARGGQRQYYWGVSFTLADDGATKNG